MSEFRRRLMMAGDGGGGLPAGFSYCWGLDTSSNYNSGEFIDTGFLPNQDTRVIMKAMSLQQQNTQTPKCFFGTETPRFSCLIQSTSVRADYNSTMKQNLYGYPLALLDIDFNKNVFSVNGSAIHTFTYAQFEATRSLYIGNDNGYPSTALNGFIFNSQIYDDATLVRDYKPVKDTNGIGYLYDEITRTIYSFDKSSVRGVSLPYTLSGLTFGGSTKKPLPICLFIENYDWEIQIVFTANSGQSGLATLLDCTEKSMPWHGFTIRIDGNDTSKVNIVWNDSSIFSLSVGTEHSVSVRKQGASVIITADGNSQTLSYTYKQILDCVTLGCYHSDYGFGFSRYFNGTITSFSYNEL